MPTLSMASSTYQYRRFRLDGLDFRVLRLCAGTDSRIECELIQASLDEDNLLSYEAVSYTWGSSEKTQTIFIEGNTLAVTSNLFDLLGDLRQADDDRYLWVDAACINQDDNRERGHQVGQMSEIYDKADRVVVWLGSAIPKTGLLMEALYMLHNGTRGSNWHPQNPQWGLLWRFAKETLAAGDLKQLESDLRDAVHQLLQHPWFYRVWILQEIAKAKRGVVCCAGRTVPCRLVSLAPRLVGLQPEEHVQAVLELMPGPFRAFQPWLHESDLYTLLLKFSRTKATEPRDRVYALLSLCSTRVIAGYGSILPDYSKTEEEVIGDIITHLLGHDIGAFWQQLLPRVEPTVLSLMDGVGRGLDAFLSNVKSLPEKFLELSVHESQVGITRSLLVSQRKRLDPTLPVLQRAAGLLQLDRDRRARLRRRGLVRTMKSINVGFVAQPDESPTEEVWETIDGEDYYAYSMDEYDSPPY